MKAHQKEIREIRENATRVVANYITHIKKSQQQREKLHKRIRELQEQF